MEKIIWTNNDYEEWKERCIKYDGMSEEETTYERYCEERSWDIDDKRDNLNVQVDGCIVAFCDLGLWDGRHNGGAVIGSNVNHPRLKSRACNTATLNSASGLHTIGLLTEPCLLGT